MAQEKKFQIVARLKLGNDIYKLKWDNKEQLTEEEVDKAVDKFRETMCSGELKNLHLQLEDGTFIILGKEHIDKAIWLIKPERF